jgi:hypothetical protein
MTGRSNVVIRSTTLIIVGVLIVLVGRGALASHGSAGNLSWQSDCKQSLRRAEAALANPARPTQIAQRIRELPNDYRAEPTRDVVRFLVSYWSARDDLQAAFVTDSAELDMAAMVGWARDGVDSTAVALVPCAAELAKLPGPPSERSAVPEVVRWARSRVRWQREVDDAAYAAADYIRHDLALVKATRTNPRLAILAAASIPPENPRYQSLWTYQTMFDLLLRANN